MLMRRLWETAFTAGLMAGAVVPASAQPAPAQGEDKPILHMQCNIGSFKMLPTEGTYDISFTGTVLIDNMDGTITPEGKLRLEYNEHDKKAYFGTGKLTLKGKWKSLQWFGRDMTCRLEGHTMLRLYGEFDKDLNTGFFWYGDGAKPDKFVWRSPGYTIFCPKYTGAVGKAEPRFRPHGGH